MGFLVLGDVTAREQTFGIVSSFFATASMIAGLYNSSCIRIVQVRFDDDCELGVDPKYGVRFDISLL
jgi:hypothetical protein